MRVLQLGLLLALTSGIVALLIYITGVSYLRYMFSLPFSHSQVYCPSADPSADPPASSITEFLLNLFDAEQLPRLSDDDFEALQSLQRSFQKCVSANRLGLQAAAGKDVCKVTLPFPSDTVSKWKDPKTGELEDLSFDFNLCEALATWEQVRNSTTILTKEFIDALPNGWEDYAWRRFNKGIILNRCENKTLCLEKLSLVLPKIPPYYPRQFDRCAVIGNSGDLLKTKFGDEIDGYNVVIRENGAPIQNYTDYVGKKCTFRLLNRGSAKALDKVVELDETRKETLLIKTTMHDIMNKMIQEWPYTPTWTSLLPDDGVLREFMSSFVHIKLIKIHSPMRADPNRVVKSLPSYDKIIAARMASEKILRCRRIGAASTDPLAACAIMKKQVKRSSMVLPGQRKAVIDHQRYVRGTTMYPLEQSPGHGLLFTVPA